MRRLPLLSLCALLASASTPAAAGDLAITPVRLTLSAHAAIASMKIRNAGAAPTSLQVRVLAWTQVDGEDRLETTDAVLANPGAFDLPPGAEQLARVGLRSRAGDTTGSYRVLIQELPRQAQEHAGEIATLLRVSVPIFIEPDHATPRLSWSLVRAGASDLALQVANGGQSHVQLTRLSLTTADGRMLMQTPVSFYVLPGAVRRIPLTLPATLKAGEALSLAVSTDGPTLAAQIVVPLGEDGAATR